MTLDAETFASYYAALQLPPGSSAEQLHAQYRRLAKRCHPDRNPHRREWSEQQLRRLNEAYHALADPRALLPPSAAPAPPAARPQNAPAAPEQSARPRLGRRLLRYAALVGGVCAISIAYSNRPHSPQMTSPMQTGVALSPPPAAVPSSPPAEHDQAMPPEKSGTENSGAADSVARASLIVTHVNAEMQHAPQSRRPQRAEQLAADVLELSRLQQSIRTSRAELRRPTTRDLHRTQVADLRLALFQLERQQHLVNAETASFPAR